MRKMLERQLKNVPKEDQEKMIAMITKNPDFFQKIAAEIKAKMDGANGQKMDQMQATREVMGKYEAELRALNQPH